MSSTKSRIGQNTVLNTGPSSNLSTGSTSKISYVSMSNTAQKTNGTKNNIDVIAMQDHVSKAGDLSSKKDRFNVSKFNTVNSGDGLHYRSKSSVYNNTGEETGYRSPNIPLLIFDLIFLPIHILRMILIYFWGSKYNLKGFQFLDVIMHSDNPYFNQEDCRMIDTIGGDYRITIRDDSRIFPADLDKYFVIKRDILTPKTQNGSGERYDDTKSNGSNSSDLSVLSGSSVSIESGNMADNKTQNQKAKPAQRDEKIIVGSTREKLQSEWDVNSEDVEDDDDDANISKKGEKGDADKKSPFSKKIDVSSKKDDSKTKSRSTKKSGNDVDDNLADHLDIESEESHKKTKKVENTESEEDSEIEDTQNTDDVDDLDDLDDDDSESGDSEDSENSDSSSDSDETDETNDTDDSDVNDKKSRSKKLTSHKTGSKQTKQSGSKQSNVKKDDNTKLKIKKKDTDKRVEIKGVNYFESNEEDKKTSVSGQKKRGDILDSIRDELNSAFDDE